MKEIKSSKKSIIKKIFIKICRLFGYEIIDQSNFFVPTLNKSLNERLSIKGKKSINLPLGEVKITRKIKSLDIIIRTCSSVNMLTQNKERIFQKEKIDYTLRSINSILRSIKYAKKSMNELLFKIYVVDHNSDQNIIDKMKPHLNIRLLNNDVNLGLPGSLNKIVKLRLIPNYIQSKKFKKFKIILLIHLLKLNF